MNHKSFTALFALAGFIVSAAHGQTKIASPSTPAPAVKTEQGAPAVVSEEDTAVSAAAAPTRIVHLPRLPSTTEITRVAAAQGRTIDRIDQTGSQITVTAHAPDGTSHVTSYRLLANVAAVASAVPATTTTVVTAVAPRTRTIVYEDPDPFYYFDDPFYYPRRYYSPVSVNLGFGFGYPHYNRYRGGYHRYHRHGRW